LVGRVIGAGPSGSDSIVATVETIGTVVDAHHIDRRMGVTSCRLSETYGVGVCDVGDLGGGDGSQAYVGETIEPRPRRDPDFTRDAEYGAGPVVPR
jgi:hypothetical protein